MSLSRLVDRGLLSRGPRALHFLLGVLLLTAAGAPSCSRQTTAPPANNQTPNNNEGPRPIVEVIATGLEAPWDVAFTPDGRVFVTERDRGVVSELRDGGKGERVEVRSFEIDSAGEGGLMGLAASPDFESDGLLYVYYTTRRDNRIVRFGLDTAPESVLTGIPSGRIHNGGRIAFGPDGLLYAATGDSGDARISQDPTSLAGKILRMNPDGSVPDDNPRSGSLVFALGIRNAQGLAWNAAGELYATDFGPQVDDEINRIQPDENYGWPEVTGTSKRSEFVDAVVVRQPRVASWSGAGFLVGGAIPQWEDHLFVAALRGERLWRFAFSATGDLTEHQAMLSGEYGRLRHVTQAPDGSLWVLTNNRDGRGSPGADDDRILRVSGAE
ncbi:MAG: PQQ-dependent sugar dehydrogenase [Bradymonadaceae bacterium]|nr:PQQ-dependent sugar dehydrogenase [Lujinxingiaceae bacterium]